MECLQRNYPHQQIKLLYDVSCTLKSIYKLVKKFRYLLYKRYTHYDAQGGCCDDLLSVFQLATPIFHCYGHKLKYQVCILMIRLICMQVDKTYVQLSSYGIITKVESVVTEL